MRKLKLPFGEKMRPEGSRIGKDTKPELRWEQRHHTWIRTYNQIKMIPEGSFMDKHIQPELI